ncbi:MAG TPA: DUF2188 domain-containing protein [Actinomycetota bacterium]|nr:DUF2188 domain-containing protein [Actinomycetota bacterium]
MEGAVTLGIAMFIIAGITVYLIGTMIRSIQREKETKLRLWKNFGLSLGFCGLFLISWLAHGIAEWQVYTDEQRTHNEPVELGDFAGQFSQSTLENWQSEFLQLFSFTVMAAVLIHKGSAESKDGSDRVEEALKRIEDHLGTALAREDAKAVNQNSAVHVVPDNAQGWALQEESTYEPAGYYDTQEEAIAAGRGLAGKKSLTLVIHSDDGTVRDKVGESRG